MSYIRNSSEDLVWNTNTDQYEPERSGEDEYISADTVIISNTTFKNNTDIVSVDLQNTPFVDNNMSFAFQGCTNLVTITNINNNVTNLAYAFRNCNNLINIPSIPNNVTNLDYTFSYCNSLTATPVIPNSITSLNHTFYNCKSLTTAPVIPNSITNMQFTFSISGLTTAPEIPESVTDLWWTFGGTKITTAPEIPQNVTNMSYTFHGCDNLIGNVYIHSEIVENASFCFTELGGIHNTKYVYIPFRDSNNNYTTTYNSFISAGYDTNGTKDDVYLRGIDLIEYICRYYDSNIGSYVELYLYEFDKGNGKRYYTFENNVYTDVTEQVQVNEEVSSAFMPTYYAHRSSSAQPWTRDYFWAQSQFYYTIPSTTSDFVGYPYNFNNSSGFNVYIQNMTSFGLTKYYNGKKVVVGEDTSGYINTYPYVLTGPEASSTSTKVYDYIYNYIAITRVHNRSLIYNSKRYFIYKLDRYVNKTYLAYTGEDTGTVFYCSNLTNSYAFCILNFNNSVSSALNIGIYDTLDNCIYASYNIGKSFSTDAYIFEKAIRTPNLDTDTLPW